VIALGRSLAWSVLLACALGANSAAVVTVVDEGDSLLMSPLHLEEEPPPIRSGRALSLGFGEAHGRTREEALEQVNRWLEALRQDRELHERTTGLRELIRQLRPSAGGDGVLGTFPEGVLAPEFDEFLLSAEVDQVSGVIETGKALHLVQRIETYAAVRQLFLEGRGEVVRARSLELRAQLEGGGSFRELAREHSMDLPSAERGGDYAVFERGPRDSQLKRAAFDLEVGELSLPIETPLGWHLLQRVDPGELAPELHEKNWGRFRAVLITHAGSSVAANPLRSLTEARALTEEIHVRLSRGEPFEPIARYSNDDPGGKDRAGDLGWIHRKTPRLPIFLRTAFLLDPGELSLPTETEVGWIIVRRDR